MDDQRFKWRVRAALLKIASIRKNSQVESEIQYAESILRNPLQDAPVLEALCAVDPGVSDLVEVDEINTVNTEAVLDETLLYIADWNFPWLAEQYVAGDLNEASLQGFVGSDGGVATGF